MLDGVGQELLDNYNTFDLAKELVDGGEMRFPGDYYGEHQNQRPSNRFETLTEWVDYAKDAFAEYLYIYSEGGWTVITVFDNKTKWLKEAIETPYSSEWKELDFLSRYKLKGERI
jgi:hypothetical protein